MNINVDGKSRIFEETDEEGFAVQDQSYGIKEKL